MLDIQCGEYVYMWVSLNAKVKRGDGIPQH